MRKRNFSKRAGAWILSAAMLFNGLPVNVFWLLQESREQGGPEEALKYFFVFAINAMPEVKKGIETNYGKAADGTGWRQKLHGIWHGKKQCQGLCAVQ